ncbi:MAG: hypothetical protein J6Z01_07075 [Bacteroidales bacterium]|nr:hypothetical protein [Bacteroidales bacterium]
MSIKAYKLDEMSHTPFVRKDSLDYFNSKGIELTNDEKSADIYLSRFFPVKSKKEMLLWRIKRRFIPILVWTHEPRYNTMLQKHFPSKFYIPDIHIMNCYTGDVLFSPWCIYGSWSITHKVGLATKEHFETHKKNVCSLGSFRHEPLIINNKNIDLTEFRQQLSLHGYRKTFVDPTGQKM